MKLILFEYLFYLFEFYTNRYYSWNNSNDSYEVLKFWIKGY